MKQENRADARSKRKVDVEMPQLSPNPGPSHADDGVESDEDTSRVVDTASQPKRSRKQTRAHSDNKKISAFDREVLDMARVKHELETELLRAQIANEKLRFFYMKKNEKPY